MHRLPAELACSVFELLCFQDRITVTHVCKLWRQIAIGHGHLWSRIRCRDTITMATLLERAHCVPVDLQVIDISWPNFDAVIQLVAAHLDHIRVLVLQPADTLIKLNLDRIATIFRSFARAAPLLEVVDIQLFNRTPEMVSQLRSSGIPHPDYSMVPAGVFSRHAPVLRQLSFRTMTLPLHAVDAFSAVTRLDIDSRFLSRRRLLALAQMPLRCLRLEVLDYELPRVPPPRAFQLKELWITDMDPRPTFHFPGPLLHYLGFPHVRHFTSHGNANWLDVMTSAPRTRPHTLLIEHWAIDPRHGGHAFNRDSYEAWRLIGDGSFVSDELYISACGELSRVAVQQVFSNLRELVVPYRVLSNLTNDLAFPELLRVSVRVTATDASGSQGLRPDVAIICPKLRTLELWGGDGHSRGPTVHAAQVIDVVEALVFHGEKPPTLIICDLEITHSASEWGRIEELVGEIERLDGPAPVPFVLELRSKWHATVQY